MQTLLSIFGCLLLSLLTDSCSLVCQVFAGLKPWARRLVSQVGCAHPTGCWLRLDGSYRIHSWVILKILQTSSNSCAGSLSSSKCGLTFSARRVNVRGASATQARSYLWEKTDRWAQIVLNSIIWQLGSFPLKFWPPEQNENNYNTDKGW